MTRKQEKKKRGKDDEHLRTSERNQTGSHDEEDGAGGSQRDHDVLRAGPTGQGTGL